MSNSCKVPEVKPIVIKRFGVSGLVPTIPTTTDCNLWSKTDLKDGELAINIRDKKLYIRADEQILEITNQASGGSSGTVTSVGLSMPSAFTVASSPVTSSGTIVVTGAGTTSQYIRGDGSLATFPTIPSAASLSEVNAGVVTNKYVAPDTLQDSDLAIKFKWTLDFTSGTLSIIVYAPQDLSIDSVTDIVNSPTTTITVNSSPYTLGNTINTGDEIEITVDTSSVINLNITKL